jgi:hypothetical protein
MMQGTFGIESNAGFFLLSSPLWGSAGEGGNREVGDCGSSPSLALPHKGGGSRDSKTSKGLQ